MNSVTWAKCVCVQLKREPCLSTEVNSQNSVYFAFVVAEVTNLCSNIETKYSPPPSFFFHQTFISAILYICSCIWPPLMVAGSKKPHTGVVPPLSARGRSCCVTSQGPSPASFFPFLFFSVLCAWLCSLYDYCLLTEVLLCSRLTALQGQSLRRGRR